MEFRIAVVKNPLNEWREAPGLFGLLVHVRQRS